MKIRKTSSTVGVLRMFADKYPEALAGADIINSTHIFSGTLYPILERLEQAGWLLSEWETVSPAEVRRPRRKYYSLTGTGRVEAAKALAEADLRYGKSAGDLPNFGMNLGAGNG